VTGLYIVGFAASVLAVVYVIVVLKVGEGLPPKRSRHEPPPQPDRRGGRTHARAAKSKMPAD